MFAHHLFSRCSRSAFMAGAAEGGTRGFGRHGRGGPFGRHRGGP